MVCLGLAIIIAMIWLEGSIIGSGHFSLRVLVYIVPAGALIGSGVLRLVERVETEAERAKLSMRTAVGHYLVRQPLKRGEIEKLAKALSGGGIVISSNAAQLSIPFIEKSDVPIPEPAGGWTRSLRNDALRCAKRLHSALPNVVSEVHLSTLVKAIEGGSS